MRRRGYSRDDVETRSGSPAVKVKVYGSLSDGFAAFAKSEPDASPRFTEDWVRENFDDEYLDRLFWNTCEWEWEQLEQDAVEILGVSPRDVSREGRSGGWCVVGGLPDVSEWDAVRLAKWRKFERYAQGLASGIPCQMVSSLYFNEWENREDDDDPGAECPMAEAVA